MSDSPLHAHDKAQPLKPGEVRTESQKGQAGAHDYKTELKHYKDVSQTPLLKIHDQLPLTTIADAKHVPGTKHVDYGNGVSRDIKLDQHGTVVKVYNPANHEVWQKGNYGWTISEPGHKPWHAKNMKVEFNRKTEELKWQVNSKESFKRLDKKEEKFHDPNADVKKTQQSHNVDSPEHRSSSMPMISLQGIRNSDGSERHCASGILGLANNSADVNATYRSAAGISDTTLHLKNPDLSNAEGLKKSLQRLHYSCIPGGAGVDSTLLSDVSKLVVENEHSKPVGRFTEFRNKISDFEKHPIKNIESYYTKLATIIFSVESERKLNKTEEDRYTCINEDPNKTPFVSTDLGIGQWNVRRGGAHGLMEFFNKKDSALFDICFSNKALPANWRDIVGNQKQVAMIEKNLKNGHWRHDYTADLLDKDSIAALDAPLRNKSSESHSRMEVALALFKDAQVEYKGLQIKHDLKIFDGDSHAIGAYKQLTPQAKGVLNELRDNDGARMMVPIMAHRGGCNGLVDALNSFAKKYRHSKPETHDGIVQMLSDSLPRVNADKEVNAVNNQLIANGYDNQVAYDQD